MAGVLEHLVGSQKKHAVPRQTPGVDKILELQSAKEILAEVFGVDISDVDEMIQSRFNIANPKDAAIEKEANIPRFTPSRNIFCTRSLIIQEIERKVLKYLSELPEKSQRLIKEKYHALAEDPFPDQGGDKELLHLEFKFYRLRHWNMTRPGDPRLFSRT